MSEIAFTSLVDSIVTEVEIVSRHSENKQKIKVNALIDTGATDIFINPDVADRLKANISSSGLTHTANGPVKAGSCIITLDFCGYTFYNVKAFILPNMHSDLLLGMNILNTGNSSIRTDAGVTIFSFEKVIKPLII